MIVTKILNTGYAICDLHNNEGSKEAMKILMMNKVKEHPELTFPISIKYGAKVSSIKNIYKEVERDPVMSQYRYVYKFKYKVNTTKLLYTLDKIYVKHIFPKVLRYKENCRYIRYKANQIKEYYEWRIKPKMNNLKDNLCTILHLNR